MRQLQATQLTVSGVLLPTLYPLGPGVCFLCADARCVAASRQRAGQQKESRAAHPSRAEANGRLAALFQ
eukprot:11013120-Heterocapsa_arctica.AAC.1